VAGWRYQQQGVLVAPFARRQARAQVPRDQAKLKEILERRP